MEFIDLYDEDMRPLGKKVPRSHIREQDDFFFIVHVWIQDSNGAYLIQKRSKDDDFRPYLWATTMGIVASGETSSLAAIKEVREELGLSLEKDDLHLVARYKTRSSYANHFTDVFLVKKDVKIEDLRLEPSEVEQVKFVQKDQLYAMINTEQFWDYKELLHVDEYFIDLEKSE